MLFTPKRANVIQTLLDMTAASANLATMARIAHSKNLNTQNFLQLSAEEKDQYIRYINLSRYYISDYVVNLTPYEQINKTVMVNRDPTALFFNIRNYDLFVWIHYYAARDTIFPRNITRADIEFAQGFPTWLGKEPCRKLVTMKTLPILFRTGPEVKHNAISLFVR